MNVGAVDIISVSYLGKCQHISQHLSGSVSLNTEVQRFATQMAAVRYAVGISIMLGAANAAGPVAGSAKVTPHIVSQLNQSVIRFNRESIAIGGMVFAAAALKFFPAPILDSFPEVVLSLVSRVSNAFFGYRRYFTGSNNLPDTLSGCVTENTVYG